MKCPDCGSRLSEIMVEGKLSHRCFKCGGFWTDSETVNRLTSQTLATWRRIKIAGNWLSGGSGVCPQDGTKLEKFTGESIPLSILVKRCIRCGKWWFSGDTLHELKPAQEAKVNYLHTLGLSSNVSSLLLPLMVILILGVGIGVGVSLNRTRQQSSIDASLGVTNYSAVYLGQGKEIVTFKTKQSVKNIQYREVGQPDWINLPIEQQEGINMIELYNLSESKNYEVSILGEKYLFTAN